MSGAKCSFEELKFVKLKDVPPSLKELIQIIEIVSNILLQKSLKIIFNLGFYSNDKYT